MRWGALLGIALLASAAAPRAYAQSADADALTKEGLDLRRQRRDAEALDAFRRAYALKATPRTLTQIALAEQALGRWVDAEADLDAALQATGDAWIAPHRSALLEGLANIRSHLGWLEIAADVPAPQVWVNGAPLGTLPTPKPVRVEAGSVVVELRADGYVPARRVTFVEPGGSARETVHMVPLAPEAPPPAKTEAAATPPAPSVTPAAPSVTTEQPARTEHDARARNAAYVALGAGAVGLALGAYFGVRTLDAKNKRDSECSLRICSTPDGATQDGFARAHAVSSTAWLIAGAVAATTGVVLLWLSRERVVDHSGVALRLAPVVGPDRAGGLLQVGGSW